MVCGWFVWYVSQVAALRSPGLNSDVRGRLRLALICAGFLAPICVTWLAWEAHCVQWIVKEQSLRSSLKLGYSIEEVRSVTSALGFRVYREADVGEGVVDVTIKFHSATFVFVDFFDYLVDGPLQVMYVIVRVDPRGGVVDIR